MIEFSELEAPVTDRLTKGFSVGSWTLRGESCLLQRLDFNAQTKGSAAQSSLTLNLIDELTLKGHAFANNVELRWHGGEVGVNHIWTQYRFGGKNPRHTIGGNLDGVLKYGYADDVFNAASETKLLDGLTTTAAVSTRVKDDVLAGLSFTYDPSRSGLMTYKLGSRFSNVKQIRNGDATVSYDATTGLRLGAGVPLGDNKSVAVLADKQSIKVGGEYRSPCGAQVITFVDWGARLLGVTALRNIRSDWKVGVSFGFDLTRLASAPSFGLSFTTVV